jgi:hypothetical protein
LGAVAERVKFSAWCLFAVLWATIVYNPVCHWVWNVNGWLFQKGVLDFAGGTVVHVLAGVSALALLLILPKRHGYPRAQFMPHSVGWTLIGAAMLFLLTTLGAGLFISTVCQTQQQAIMACFFFFVPAFMLSGFAFPIRNMPLLAQAISFIDPVRWFMEIVRGVFLKGIGIRLLWPQMLALLIIGTIVLSTSALRFHKRLD